MSKNTVKWILAIFGVTQIGIALILHIGQIAEPHDAQGIRADLSDIAAVLCLGFYGVMKAIEDK